MIRNNHFSSQQTRFKAHSENICGLIENSGILFRPYAHPTLMFFSQLSSGEPSDVLRNMMNYYQICLNTFNQGQSLKEPRALTRQAFARLHRWGVFEGFWPFTTHVWLIIRLQERINLRIPP